MSNVTYSLKQKNWDLLSDSPNLFAELRQTHLKGDF